jgi:CBS domain-containing protein
LRKAADEVRSWTGDDDAQRRRRLDEVGYWRSASRFANLRAADIMTDDVQTVRSIDPVERAARFMRRCDCGALPVIGESGRLLGMITDRDIVVRLIARGVDARYALVRDCMTDEAVACHADEPIERCLRQLSRHQIRRLPIVDDDGRLVGIVSQGDLARLAGESPGRGERRAMAEMLAEVSEPNGK